MKSKIKIFRQITFISFFLIYSIFYIVIQNIFMLFIRREITQNKKYLSFNNIKNLFYNTFLPIKRICIFVTKKTKTKLKIKE